MLNLLKEEKTMEKLLEKRGVGGHPWKSEIDRIMAYIRDYVKESPELYRNHSDIEFDVPYQISNTFTFLGDLEIHVVASYANGNYNNGGGSLSSNGKVFFSHDLKQILKKNNSYYQKLNNKLYHMLIKIICFYNDNGNVYLGQIMDTFYHEINHAYDCFISCHDNSNSFNKSSDKAEVKNEFEITNPNLTIPERDYVKHVIRTCIYRLFSETEFNAMIAGVYGYLREINSQYKNFSNDYKKTTAYIIYSYIKEEYEDALNLLSDEDIKNLMILFKSKNIYIPMRQNSVSQFRNSFKQKVNYLLGKLIKEIGRVASLWYEDSYNEKIHNNNHPFEPVPDEPLDKRYFKK